VAWPRGPLCKLVSTLFFFDTWTLVDPSQDYPLYSGFVHLGAGLACGSTGLAAGYAIGIVGDSVGFVLRSY
jgi:ATP synthase proteolipid subunit